MSDKRSSPLSLVLIPALVTLVVSITRLLGELYGWNPSLFGSTEGGGAGAVVAIVWLIFVFGLWFGVVLQRRGDGPANKKRALLTSLGAVGLMIGSLALCGALDLVAFPDPEAPVEARGTPYLMASFGIGVVAAFAAWPRLAMTMLVYAVLARIPVVVITWLAVHYGWDTHHAKTPDGLIAPPADELTMFLIMPQITAWPAFTVVVGTLCGCLGAYLGGSKKK